ncbi:MAG: GldG family protein [Clostridia bacterium]|nr:GldG family protein [Clostridia bacterium]
MAFEEKEKNELPEEETERTVAGFESDEVTLSQTAESAELLDEILENEDTVAEDEAPAEETKRKFTLPKFSFKRDGRRVRAGTAAMILTVVVVAAIFLLNVIVGIVEDRWPIKIDTTETQIYTLSDEATDYAKGIKKEVQIVVCLAETALTAPSTGMDAFDSMYKQLHAALDSFRSLSGGKVSVEYIDLNEQPIRAVTYTEMGATDGSVVFICGENSRVLDITTDFTSHSMTEVYNAMYQGQSVTPTSIVETTLAVSIEAVAGEKVASVAVLTGHSASEYVVSDISSLLTKTGYNVTALDITTQAEIPEDAALLVIPAPNEDYTKDEIARIRQWVENDNNYNHHLLVVPSLVETPNLEMYVEDTLGVVITEQLVAQTDSSYIYSGIQNPLYSYADGAETEFTSGDRVLAPYTRRLLEAGDRPEFTTLFSFPESARLSSLEDVYAAEEAGNTNYALTEPNASDYPLVGATLSSTYYYNSDNESATHGLVIGSFYFMTGLSSIDENGDLVENTVNHILDKGDSIEFDDKTLDSGNVLSVDSAATALTVFVIFVALVPVATLVVCLVVFLKRRHL